MGSVRVEVFWISLRGSGFYRSGLGEASEVVERASEVRQMYDSGFPCLRLGDSEP